MALAAIAAAVFAAQPLYGYRVTDNDLEGRPDDLGDHDDRDDRDDRDDQDDDHDDNDDDDRGAPHPATGACE